MCSTTAAELGFTLGVVLSCTTNLDAASRQRVGFVGISQSKSKFFLLCVFLAERHILTSNMSLQGQAAPQGFMLRPSTVLRPQVTPHLSLNIKLSQNRF